MVLCQRHSVFLTFTGGLCGMEIAALLLLTASFTAALPLQPAHRSEGHHEHTAPCWYGGDDTHRSDTVLAGATVQALGVQRSEVTQERHVPLLRIVPFLSEDKRLDMDADKQSLTDRLRLKRASQRGCQLGTCQLHILANTLYHISKTSGKEESKKANDPQGYGR